jgi:hypothetical protein
MTWWQIAELTLACVGTALVFGLAAEWLVERNSAAWVRRARDAKRGK